MTPEVTVLIVGSYPGKKLARARLDGVVILPLARVPDLLSSGELQLTSAGDVSEQTSHMLISECRSILAHPPGPWRWAALCTQLERCDAELLPELVAYLQGALSHQQEMPLVSRVPEQSTWALTQAHLDADDADPIHAAHAQDLYAQHVQRAMRIWQAQSPCASLRHHHICPDGWLGALLKGERSPRFSLLSALDLSAHSMSGKRVTSLLEHEDISGLVGLRLGAKNAMAASFFTSLVRNLERHPLESLALGGNKLTLKSIAPLAQAPSLPHLKYLNLEAAHYDVPEGLVSWLGQQPISKHVKALRYYGRMSELDLSTMVGANTFPSLEHVMLSPYNNQPGEFTRVLYQLGGLHNLQTLTLSDARLLRWYPIELSNALCDVFAPEQVSLDLSRLEYGGWGEEGDLEFCRDLVRQPGLMAHLKALHLGCYVDQVREEFPELPASKLCA